MLPLEEKEVRILDQMLPNVAAQLRVSMASIFLSACSIATPEQRDADPELDRAAAKLTMSCHQLLRIAGNLSAITELSAERALHVQNADIVAFCAELCDKVSALFAMRGVALQFSTERQQCILRLDTALFERLLLNLLSNALKFTPDGGKVTVQLKRNEKTVQLRVTDTGCGMDGEKLDTLFDRFRVEERLDPPPCGIGLGLPLCRSIARRHGGTIMAESQVGRGTAVTVSFPNVRCSGEDLLSERFDYAGGYNHVLLEMSDALPSEAFLQKYLD